MANPSGQAIGYELELYAKSLGLLNFEFLVVESNLENLNILKLLMGRF
jgi:hypothetical protein